VYSTNGALEGTECGHLHIAVVAPPHAAAARQIDFQFHVAASAESRSEEVLLVFRCCSISIPRSVITTAGAM
jgi:hypothetical protein